MEQDSFFIITMMVVHLIGDYIIIILVYHLQDEIWLVMH